MKYYRRALFVVSFILFSCTLLQAQWVQTAGPAGGPITAIAVHATAPGGPAVFVGTFGGGNFRSTDNGATWTAVSNGLSFGGTYFGATTFAPKGSNIFSGTAGGVYLSTNNGAMWTVMNSGLTSTGVLALQVSGSNLFAGTSSGGVFRSTNDGTSWTAVNTGLTTNRVNAFTLSGTNLFAGTQGGGVFLSTDNGASWTTVNSGLTETTIRTLAANGGTVFAGTLNGIFKTTNNGTSWTLVSPRLTVSMHVSGTNVYASGLGAAVSADNGGSWTPINTGLDTSLVNAIAANGSTLFAGSAAYFSGMFVSSNGGASWSESNVGLVASHVRALAVRDNGGGSYTVAAGTNENGVYVSTDNGNNWTSTRNGLNNAAKEAVAFSGANLFAGGFLGVHLSTNNGASWTAVNNGLPFTATVSEFAVSGSNVFAATGSGVFLTTNNGGNWTAMNSGITNLGIKTLAINGTNLYAAGNGMYLSTNNGASWTSIGAGITSTSIRSIAFIGTDIFAGTQNGVFRSTNDGGSWTAVNTGLTVVGVNRLTAVGNTLVAGTTFGLYRTTNSGANWTNISTGLPENLGIVFPTILSLTSIPAGTGGANLLAGTFFLGVWRRPVSEVTDVRPITSAIPDGFALAQNYPNPFNPNTTIGFDIANSGVVSVRIYDLLGKEVAVLVSESLAPGRYEVPFDGAGLASGTYFYRLQAGGFAQTKKLVLQK